MIDQVGGRALPCKHSFLFSSCLPTRVKVHTDTASLDSSTFWYVKTPYYDVTQLWFFLHQSVTFDTHPLYLTCRVDSAASFHWSCCGGTCEATFIRIQNGWVSGLFPFIPPYLGNLAKMIHSYQIRKHQPTIEEATHSVQMVELLTDLCHALPPVRHWVLGGRVRLILNQIIEIRHYF